MTLFAVGEWWFRNLGRRGSNDGVQCAYDKEAYRPTEMFLGPAEVFLDGKSGARMPRSLLSVSTARVDRMGYANRAASTNYEVAERGPWTMGCRERCAGLKAAER